MQLYIIEENSRHAKQQENVTHNQRQKQSIESDPKMAQMLGLADTDFKGIITNMFKDLKESMVLMSEWIGNLSREFRT